MVAYTTVQVLVGQRFLLTTIEAQFLMEKLCLALLIQRRSIYA
jgi:hypothetical protein